MRKVGILRKSVYLVQLNMDNLVWFSTVGIGGETLVNIKTALINLAVMDFVIKLIQ